jgi:signal transduction histidine kinase
MKTSSTAGNAVHDLNNKIRIILARCDLLETHCQLGTKATTDLEAIRKAAEALATMVNQLPDVHREQL